MLHLLKYNLKVKLKNFGMTFWPLAFPLILGTLFYFAFGNISDADFQTVPVAVVEEAHADQVFLAFLDQIEGGEDKLLSVEKMTDEQAQDKLEAKKVSGIYYVGTEPSLTVASSGIEESILQSVLSSYENTRSTVRNMLKIHPEGIFDGLRAMLRQQNSVQELSLGGRTIDGNVQFFYALIAMGCLYGCFIGVGTAIRLQANLTALAARRCVTPTHKLKLVLSELISSFLLGYVDVVILLLYLRYVLKLDFQGQMGRMLVICILGIADRSFHGNLCGKSGKDERRGQDRNYSGNFHGMQLPGWPDEQYHERYCGKTCTFYKPDQSGGTDLRCILLYQCV